jgi:hypothetical protein
MNWISVQERLPAVEPHESGIYDSERLLMFNGEFVCEGIYTVWIDGEFPPAWFRPNEDMIRNVTHWMPLPEPPDQEQKS